MKGLLRRWLRAKLIAMLIHCESHGVVRYDSKVHAWRVLG